MNFNSSISEAECIPTPQDSLPDMWDVSQCFSAVEGGVAYHDGNMHVLLVASACAFACPPVAGADVAIAWANIDERTSDKAPTHESFAQWPGLHVNRDDLGHSTLRVLTELRLLMQCLTPTQQNILSKLVCDLGPLGAME